MSESVAHCVQTCLALPGQRRWVDKRQRIFSTGDKVEFLHVVVSGEVVLTRSTSEGNELVLQRTSAQQIVAEGSLVSTAYHCDAYATQSTQIHSIAAGSVRDLLAQDRVFALSWISTVSHELKLARAQASILRLKNVSRRLDAWLLLHGGTLPLNGERVAVAREIGVTPEALYRELAKRA